MEQIKNSTYGAFVCAHFLQGLMVWQLKGNYYLDIEPKPDATKSHSNCGILKSSLHNSGRKH